MSEQPVVGRFVPPGPVPIAEATMFIDNPRFWIFILLVR
jgi:hypothetical protein